MKTRLENDFKILYSGKNGTCAHEFIVDLHKHYDSINIVLERDTTMYQSDGRFQNLEESIEIDKEIIGMLDRYEVEYFKVPINNDTANNIISVI